MNASIELQVISKILTSDNQTEVEALLDYDESYYSVLKTHAQFILRHRDKYGEAPDVFTFQAEFPDITLVPVHETLAYLREGMRKNKQRIMLVETFNKIKDLGTWDVSEAWQYIESQCEIVGRLDSIQPLNIVKQAEERSHTVAEYSRRARIPTGFPEIDKAMYGGLSTVEELVIWVARTNTGKSWIATRMMETAQKNGFPVLYYSPEMQGSFLATRFDTWRGHFKNSQLFRGNYTEQYTEYLKKLKSEQTDAFILEDINAPNDEVNVPILKKFVKANGIKLLIIDGLSYMTDSTGKVGDTDYVKFRNLCSDLFKLSKQCGCAVSIMMQANRASKETKDDKGEPFPNIYNIEGSDHPGRIATQVFSARQIFDKHVLDIRLEKSRNANNQKPVFSYVWDIDSGNVQYIQSADDIAQSEAARPNISTGTEIPDISDISDEISLADTDDVDF